MSGENNQERVRILDKEYTIACPPDERHALQDSARLLDEKMREIRKSGKVVGTERIAVMAALNIAHELLMEKECGEVDEIQQRLKEIQERIDTALEQEDRQLML